MYDTCISFLFREERSPKEPFAIDFKALNKNFKNDCCENSQIPVFLSYKCIACCFMTKPGTD